MKVDIQGLERDPMLRGRVGRLVGAALETIKAAPVRARVTFFDDDGPKGGLALRCAVNLHVPYRPAIHIGSWPLWSGSSSAIASGLVRIGATRRSTSWPSASSWTDRILGRLPGKFAAAK